MAPEIMPVDLEITLCSQEARRLHKSARHLPIVLTECFCDVSRKISWDNIEVFRRVISQEIFKPLEIDLQEEAQGCHSLFKKFGVNLNDEAPKSSGIRKTISVFYPGGYQIIELIKKLDEVIWQAEILCSLGVKDKTAYQDLLRRWRRKILETGPKIKQLTLDIIAKAI